MSKYGKMNQWPVRTVVSGNVFAVTFTAPVYAASPPKLIMHPHATRREKVNIDILLTPSGIPESKI